MLQRSPTYVVSRPARGRLRQLAAHAPAGQARLRHRPLAQRADAACVSSSSARASRRRSRRLIIDMVRKAAGPGLRRRHPFHAALQSLGPAPVPGARRRPVRGDQGRARPRWSPTRSRPSPPNGIRLKSGSELDGRHHRHRDRARTCSCWAASRSPSTARAVDLAEDLELQGHDVFAACRTSPRPSATPTRRGR